MADPDPAKPQFNERMNMPQKKGGGFRALLAQKLAKPQLNKLDTRRNTLLPGSDDAEVSTPGLPVGL